MSIEDALDREGYELFFAENGKEGLSLFKEVSPIVIILDLRMPVMDGFELLDKIKPKLTDSFLVTVITGHSQDEDVIKCYDLGVNSFFRKPFNFIELRCMVQRSIKLKLAEKQVRILRGLIPICCSCKKIRDDQGYWNQLEVYIRDHSEANFTHGICPKCAQKLYP